MAVGNNRLAEILKASLDPRTNKEGESLFDSSCLGANLNSGTRPSAGREETRLLCDPITDCSNIRLRRSHAPREFSLLQKLHQEMVDRGYIQLPEMLSY